jgi:nitrate/nitrite transporter NarK
MKTATFASELPLRLIGGLACGAVLMACAGCQTFSLTEEDFQRQQRGETVDRETGAVVGTVGSVGFLGALLGLAVAEAARK